MDDALIIILACGAMTQLTRFAPFLAFARRTPAWVLYLGRVLPYAVMAMLVVYCLRGVSLADAPHGAPEAVACAVTVALQVWRRDTLISIIGGTACYMSLVQAFF
ncbi:MAG: AzlD domain-containing protein [Synergistaceae bacterium]|nr:AzlD domain-containing protein [Synergistaceae bacterium]